MPHLQTQRGAARRRDHTVILRHAARLRAAYRPPRRFLDTAQAALLIAI
jgi:hypothetical protein